MAYTPSTEEEMDRLRRCLDRIEGVTTHSSRPGNAAEGRFMGSVALHTADRAAVERLLERLGEPFWAIFHVGEQKCELGFRVEVTRSQGAVRHDLRFWGCPEWGLHRIRRWLAARVRGEVGRSEWPPFAPPADAPDA